MEKAARSELLSTITSQSDQLQQYKAKLRDVVAAYKSVVKEKEALEASVAVLSVVEHDRRGSSEQQSDSVAHSDQEDFSDPLRTTSSEGKEEVSSLKIQVKTLSSTMTTLTQEKNKIEVNFIADKKQMKREIEELNIVLAEEQHKFSTQSQEFEVHINELKSRIRTQQLEREKDQTNHSLMLKELQELVSVERMTKEHLINQLEDCKKQLKDNAEVMAKKPTELEAYEHQMHNLQEECASLSNQLRAAEFKLSQPQPLVLELQNEIQRLKEVHQRQIGQEKLKQQEAECGLQSQAKQKEERMSSLEASLSELSHSVGNYERLKCQDQLAMSKMREKITQLDLENTALVQASKLSGSKSERDDDDMDVDKIVERIKHLRELLISASEKSGKSVKLSNLFVEDFKKGDENYSKVKQYKNELEKVRHEFEKYKNQTQSVIKSGIQKNSSSDTSESLKEQNLELKNKLRVSSSHYQEELVQLQLKVDSLNQSLSSKEDKMNMEVLQLKCLHQKEIGQLELELKKQRERMLAILSEKEQEIKRALQVKNSDDFSSCQSDSMVQYRTRKNDRYNPSSQNESEETRAINRLLSHSNEHENEASLLHFSQERARTEVEISTLRKQKREVEMSMRESNAVAGHKESQLKEEIISLKEQIAEVERQSNREGANMEYIKNVLLKLFTSTDIDGKKQMMKALMTILQFSPQERKKVQELALKGWWVS